MLSPSCKLAFSTAPHSWNSSVLPLFVRILLNFWISGKIPFLFIFPSLVTVCYHNLSELWLGYFCPDTLRNSEWKTERKSEVKLQNSQRRLHKAWELTYNLVWWMWTSVLNCNPFSLFYCKRFYLYRWMWNSEGIFSIFS